MAGAWLNLGLCLLLIGQTLADWAFTLKVTRIKNDDGRRRDGACLVVGIDFSLFSSDEESCVLFWGVAAHQKTQGIYAQHGYSHQAAISTSLLVWPTP
jgi:hypothetical protein